MSLWQIEFFALKESLIAVLVRRFRESGHDPLAQNVHERCTLQLLCYFLLGLHPLVELAARLVVLRRMTIRAKRYQIVHPVCPAL